MKISTKGRYGLRLMMTLAEHYGRGPVSADTIADEQAISGAYVRLLAAGLKTAGLLRAVRGPSGGYELAGAPSQITAYDVVVALEGPIAPAACAPDPSSCPRSERCAAHEVWHEVEKAISDVLRKFTVQELAQRQRELLSEALSFCI